MSAEEIEISKSTPGCRFDIPAPPPPKPDSNPVKQKPPTAATRQFTSEVINHPDEPVVMFALEWCEFSWSVRNLFAKCGIPYQSIDLDSTEYQKDGRDGEVRAVLAERTGSPTIPQIFVGGEHVGGCTEVFDAYKEGRLQNMLTQSGVTFNNQVSVDPYTFMPAWLQPR
jgi:cysteine synthase A